MRVKSGTKAIFHASYVPQVSRKEEKVPSRHVCTGTRGLFAYRHNQRHGRSPRGTPPRRPSRRLRQGVARSIAAPAKREKSDGVPSPLMQNSTIPCHYATWYGSAPACVMGLRPMVYRTSRAVLVSAPMPDTQEIFAQLCPPCVYAVNHDL